MRRALRGFPWEQISEWARLRLRLCMFPASHTFGDVRAELRADGSLRIFPRGYAKHVTVTVGFATS